MTVVVDTPEGRRRGSSVFEIETARRDMGIRYNWRGEAALVDLGARGRLFALTSSPSDSDWAPSILPRLVNYPRASIEDRYKRIQNLHGPIRLPRWIESGPVPLILSGYPTLVRFRDPNVSTTLEIVDPDNLAASFGSGVTLFGIFLQTTEDPVSFEVESAVPLMDVKSGFHNWILRQSPVLSGLSRSDFVTKD